MSLAALGRVGESVPPLVVPLVEVLLFCTLVDWLCALVTAACRWVCWWRLVAAAPDAAASVSEPIYRALVLLDLGLPLRRATWVCYGRRRAGWPCNGGHSHNSAHLRGCRRLHLRAVVDLLDAHLLGLVSLAVEIAAAQDLPWVRALVHLIELVEVVLVALLAACAVGAHLLHLPRATLTPVGAHLLLLDVVLGRVQRNWSLRLVGYGAPPHELTLMPSVDGAYEQWDSHCGLLAVSGGGAVATPIALGRHCSALHSLLWLRLRLARCFVFVLHEDCVHCVLLSGS